MINRFNLYSILLVTSICIYGQSKVQAQSPKQEIKDFMVSFQNNLSNMQGQKNLFFSADCKNVIAITTGENIVNIDEYIKTNYFKRLIIKYNDQFISCKKGDYEFFYIYAFEDRRRLSVTFEVTKQMKIRTFVTQSHVDMLTPCENSKSENSPDNGFNNYTDNTPPGISPPVKPNYDWYLNKIEGLKKDTQEFGRKIRKQIDSIRILNDNIDDYEEKLKKAQDSIKMYQTQYDSLLIKYDTLSSRYIELQDCVNHFCDSLQSQLAIANDAFESYKINKENNKKVPIDELNKAWNIYKGIYYGNTRNALCAISKKDCLEKNPQACINISTILAYNMGNVVDELGSNPKEKLNSRSEIILFTSSVVLKSGDYTGRTEAINGIMDRLPQILIEERNNVESLTTLNQIKEYFNSGNYSESLSKFNLLYDLLELSEFKANKNAVSEAKYCSGIILLWELVDVKTIESWVFPGSWLIGKSGSKKTKLYYSNMGRIILRELLEPKNNIDETMKKNIRNALAKYPEIAETQK